MAKPMVDKLSRTGLQLDGAVGNGKFGLHCKIRETFYQTTRLNALNKVNDQKNAHAEDKCSKYSHQHGRVFVIPCF
jgi:hypothetical protein